MEVVAGGLEHVWDIGFLPDGTALVTERPGRIRLLSGTGPGAAVSEVAADLGDVYARGEGGLMGLLVHPDFAQTRRFTTCQTHQEGGTPRDIQLVTWELSPDGRAAVRVADPLVGGLPLNPSGRHSGCRPTLGPDGALYVGTGDSANPDVPQDRTRLGGKVLRLDLATGGPALGNPFAAAADPAERLVFTYGHRNVQGVTVQPETGRLFAAEHGPDVDDEVNLLRPDRRDIEHLPVVSAHLRRPAQIVPTAPATDRSCVMTSSGVSTGANVDPGWPSCPPGLRAPRRRSDFGAGLAKPSELGGFEEFFDVCPTPRLQLGDPHPRRAQLRRECLDQHVALREPLTQLLNRRRPGHREIINPHDKKIKPPRRSTAPWSSRARSQHGDLRI